MEKNIVEVVTNNKGEVVEKVADYIGVASFAAVIENLYRECLEISMTQKTWKNTLLICTERISSLWHGIFLSKQTER